MSIDEIAKQSLLYDFYGQLLTERQRLVYELYHGENLSLAEIAEELQISRQGVHDALKNGQRALDGYEEKLGLVARFLKTETAVSEIDSEILAMTRMLEEGEDETETEHPAARSSKGKTRAPGDNADPAERIARLRRIRSIIDRLEE